jgi:hypothetical protein
MINFIGWRPGPNMPKPARRGSQNVSFKDVSKMMEGKLQQQPRQNQPSDEKEEK